MSNRVDPRPLQDGDFEGSGLDSLLRLIFESSHLGIAISSMDSPWGWMNRRFSELLGYSREELKGKTWVDLTHPDDVDADMALYQRMLGGELDEYELEKRFITASGRTLSAHLKVSCARNPDRSVRFVWVYLQDLSDRRKIEQELRRRLDLERIISIVAARLASSTELDEAIDSSLEEIGRFGRASRAYLFLFREREPLMDNTHEWCAPGVPSVRHTLQGVPMGIHPTLLSTLRLGEPFHLRNMEDLPESAAGEREEYERQGIRSLLSLPVMIDGTLMGIVGFDNTLDAPGWSDADVSLLRLFAGVLAGILHRKRALDQIRFSQQRFRQVIDLVPDLIFAKDQQGRYVLVNKAMAEAYHSDVKELIGKTDEDFVESPEAVERYRKEDAEVIRTGKRTLFPANAFTDAEGNNRVFRTVKIPFTFSGMESPSILAVATEVTELVEAEVQRRHLERSMLDAQRLESLGVLAGGIAHDFNNLLLAILGNLDLALQDLPDGSPLLPLLEQATNASRKAADLTRQMLAYSGRTPFEMKDIDLNRLVEENTGFFRTVVGRSVTLAANLGPGPVHVHADPGQIQQVIMNLITNASEAIRGVSGTVRISTGVSHFGEEDLDLNALSESPGAGRYAFVHVQDDGVGMDRETRRRLFDPFFTTKFTGRGLGLAAVMGIVRGHSGAILVDSTLGEGTSIRVLLPVQKGRGLQKETVVSGKRTPGAFEGTVLLADDEPLVLRLTTRQLERLGFDVITAEDGEEALALFQDHADGISALMLDMTMPRMDGLTAFREIRRLRPKTPILFSSGLDKGETASRLSGEPKVAFVQKPFRLDDLRSAFEELLP